VSWQEGSAESAAIDLFEKWRKAQPETQKSKEHAQILEKVKDAISTHGTSQFSDLDSDTRSVLTAAGRMGYWKDINENRIFLFTHGGLKRATKGYDSRRVLKALEEAGAFFKARPKQKSVCARIPSEKRIDAFYWIDPAKLDSWDS